MPKIRVLIVDDSVTQREIFRRLLADDPELVVVAEARNGIEALNQVQAHAPDVVLMDIHMPEMDGIAATEEIMKRFPVPIVIASATLKKRDVDLAMKALEAGAVAVIEKPEGAVLLHLGKMVPELRRELIAAAKAKLPGLRRPNPPVLENLLTPDKWGVASAQKSLVEVIGISASTGGPAVLLEILSHLPKPFPIPILLVQHISPKFEEGFAPLALPSLRPKGCNYEASRAFRGGRLDFPRRPPSDGGKPNARRVATWQRFGNPLPFRESTVRVVGFTLWPQGFGGSTDGHGG